MAYSMGSHYAATLAEEIPEKISELFIAAPSSFKPGKLITFLSNNTLGNKLLEQLSLSNYGMSGFLSILRKCKVLDQKSYLILLKEIATAELRFSFYACTTYLRFLKLDVPKFVDKMNEHQIRSIIVFGKRDKNYPATIGYPFKSKILLSEQIVIDEDHNMINRNFGHILLNLLNDH